MQGTSNFGLSSGQERLPVADNRRRRWICLCYLWEQWGRPLGIWWQGRPAGGHSADQGDSWCKRIQVWERLRAFLSFDSWKLFLWVLRLCGMEGNFRGPKDMLHRLQKTEGWQGKLGNHQEGFLRSHLPTSTSTCRTFGDCGQFQSLT